MKRMMRWTHRLSRMKKSLVKRFCFVCFYWHLWFGPNLCLKKEKQKKNIKARPWAVRWMSVDGWNWKNKRVSKCLLIVFFFFLTIGPQNTSDSHRNVDSKRLETEAPSQNTSPSHCSSTLDLNFPLPGERGPACLVKVEHFNSQIITKLLIRLQKFYKPCSQTSKHGWRCPGMDSRHPTTLL